MVTGRRQPKRQITWLAQHAWLFQIGGDGLPKVAHYRRGTAKVRPLR